MWLISAPCPAAPVHLVEEKAVASGEVGQGTLFLDFGRVAFGNLKLTVPDGVSSPLRVHFGEKLDGKRIDRKPPGTVRYATAEIPATPGGTVVVAPPADGRNTKQPAAVLTPAEWGVVLPFRWVEIEGWPRGASSAGIVRQAAFAETWDDDAASFECSDEMLNRIWELCRYSIKATTFAGVYVDGDRERIPYEADAYLNQLSHYATDHDLQMARDTFDRLMDHPTWPSEWAPHMVFMAHVDWMQSGGTSWIRPRYEGMKKKLLLERAGADGLIRSDDKQRSWNDIVDWPEGERDGFVFREVNTVVNAFHLAALAKMADLARAIGNDADATEYEERFKRVHALFQDKLFDAGKGAYRDGVGTTHTSSHASLFPLAFGLVPEEHRQDVAEFLAKRGMTCSVYAAQYLLEGLFETGACEDALRLITADGDRGWTHMVESGATITWEAWDLKYKPNQDWNHAWGAAPANLLPRFVLGARPLEPGWAVCRIAPCPGELTEAKGRVPTPHGGLEVHWVRNSDFHLKADLPKGVKARVELPSTRLADKVWMDGRELPATRSGGRLVVDEPFGGSFHLVVRP
ncbi:MAG: family 78 glycoside hydrolase catalytic domain [Verrucomicrobiae bacterium]|nr:family 78 glycoside hydrolase catalytic domain [Verrucomicrobiae bacterium]